MHEVAQRNLPFMFIGAGLPQVAALAGKAKSYAERLFDAFMKRQMPELVKHLPQRRAVS